MSLKYVIVLCVIREWFIAYWGGSVCMEIRGDHNMENWGVAGGLVRNVDILNWNRLAVLGWC